MIPTNDSRWKAAAHTPPTVRLPLKMPSPQDQVDARVLAHHGINISGGWVEATEPVESKEEALRDGQAEVTRYSREHFGGHAELVAIIEYVDDPRSGMEFWSAAVAKYHSDS